MSSVRSPIRVAVPATLVYRELVLRAVASACRLVVDRDVSRLGEHGAIDLSERFDARSVSAVSEIFNNVVIHGHDGGDPEAEVRVSIEPGNRCIGVRITDTGEPFDMRAVVQPDLRQLPQGGMGLFIARSFSDRLAYRAGPPNLWHLTICASAKRDEASCRGGDSG